MTVFFIILIVLASIILSLIVLVQNPKGGGLAANIGGFSNQFMGVKQTTDVLEKGTWIFAGAIAVLCIVSTLFIGGPSSGPGTPDRLQNVSTGPLPMQQQQTPPPAQQQPPANQQQPPANQQQPNQQQPNPNPQQ